MGIHFDCVFHHSERKLLFLYIITESTFLTANPRSVTLIVQQSRLPDRLQLPQRASPQRAQKSSARPSTSSLPLVKHIFVVVTVCRQDLLLWKIDIFVCSRPAYSDRAPSCATVWPCKVSNTYFKPLPLKPQTQVKNQDGVLLAIFS